MPLLKFYRIAVTASFLLSSAAVLFALVGDSERFSGVYEEEDPVENLSVAFYLVGLGVC